MLDSPNVDLKSIDSFGDKATWDLICSGRTKGVFQLESKLGQNWAKRAKPRNISELSDLVAIIRPGCLDTMLHNKSMTKHYVDRKSGKDEIEYIHPALEPILKNTQGVLVYQEQAMRVAIDIAGFSQTEADSLRKAVGKKDAALMKQVKEKFMEGAIKKDLVNDEDAHKIFDLIQASARYSFNASHSVSYAINAFRSAYCKTHDPLKFFEVYLNHAHNKPEKQEEISELVSDAKHFNIEVYPPRLDHFYKLFTMNRSKSVIYFGYSNVKNVGEGEQFKIERVVKTAEEVLSKTVSEFCWLECLFFIGSEIKKNAFASLISVGAFNGQSNTLSRTRMLFEQKVFESLTDKEQEWIKNNYLRDRKYSELKDAISDSINRNEKINSRRIKTVQDVYNGLLNPGYTTEDSIDWIADVEKKLMGVSLTCVKTEGVEDSDSDLTCRDLSSKTVNRGAGSILVQLNRCNEYTIKKGDKAGEVMAFVSGQDFTGNFDSFVIFPKEYKQFKNLLFQDNTVLLQGEIREKESSVSFIINNVEQK